MRALFKFPALGQPVLDGDELCPCLKIQNTYDRSSRIAVHIGAFRFVCTNLAVGGGGVFAGGFMAVHAGEVPIADVTKQLTRYLEGFEEILGLYRRWAETEAEPETLHRVIGALPKWVALQLREELKDSRSFTVWDAYNRATHYATHRMRSYRTAFDLLARINCGFQTACRSASSDFAQLRNEQAKDDLLGFLIHFAYDCVIECELHRPVSSLSITKSSKSPSLELTRFRGHLTLWSGRSPDADTPTYLSP